MRSWREKNHDWRCNLARATWLASSRSRAEAQKRKDLASLLLALRKTIGVIGVGVIGAIGIIGIIGEGAAPHGAPSINPSLITNHSSLILSVRPALRLCVLCERKLMNDAVISRGYTWPASSRSRAKAQRRKDLASLLLALRKTIGIIGIGVIGVIGIIGVIGEAAAPHGAPSINPLH